MPLQAVRPKILGFISEQASAWLVALVVLLAGCALTVIVAWAAADLYQQQVRQRFQLLVNERYSRLQERFEDQEQRLASLQRFFVNSNDVSRAEFDGFAQPLLLRARAYAWAPRIFRDQRKPFEQEISRQRGTPFAIRELNSSGELAPAAERDEYVPVLYSQTKACWARRSVSICWPSRFAARFLSVRKKAVRPRYPSRCNWWVWSRPMRPGFCWWRR